MEIVFGDRVFDVNDRNTEEETISAARDAYPELGNATLAKGKDGRIYATPKMGVKG